jgi:hypothetical protein
VGAKCVKKDFLKAEWKEESTIAHLQMARNKSKLKAAVN